MSLFTRKERNAFMPLFLWRDFLGQAVDLASVKTTLPVRASLHTEKPFLTPTPEGAVIDTQFCHGLIGQIGSFKWHLRCFVYQTLPSPSRYFYFPLAYPTLPMLHWEGQKVKEAI